MGTKNPLKSRTFWLLLIFGGLAFALSWDQADPIYFTTVANVGLGAWIGGKYLASRAGESPG